MLVLNIRGVFCLSLACFQHIHLMQLKQSLHHKPMKVIEGFVVLSIVVHLCCIPIFLHCWCLANLDPHQLLDMQKLNKERRMSISSLLANGLSHLCAGQLFAVCCPCVYKVIIKCIDIEELIVRVLDKASMCMSDGTIVEPFYVLLAL